jgi:hypothetical protein
MIDFTINKYKNIPDSDILINPKEFPLITKDNKYAYDHLLKDNQTNMKGFYFFGSQYVKDNILDIPIPSTKQWNNTKIKKVNWEDKKSTAFYRGELTGCGQTIENNLQLKLSNISFIWSKDNNLIDVGITSVNNTIKIYNQMIGVNNINKYDFLFKPNDDSTKYKYIFNIQSNEFKNKSVVLNVESEYHFWYEPLLKDNKQIITINSNFSNLKEKLDYLNKNDSHAKKIASNGYKFNKKYLNKNMISTFWFYYMLNINKIICRS